jgi:hypothetical protein
MHILSILSDHKVRYPAMRVQDVYKLIHQSACGPAHAVMSSQAAREWLENEVRNLIDPYPEPAIDPISPDGTLARVHLAPYLANGGELDTLLDAFLRTSREYRANFEKLAEYLTAAQQIIPGLAALTADLKLKNFPAVHHSTAYRVAYKPAYRVVLRKYI